MLNLKIDKDLGIVYGMWIFIILGTLILYQLPFVLATNPRADYTGSSWDLASGNGVSRGITTDGTNIFVIDWEDKKIYKYNMQGEWQAHWSLAEGNDDPRGIDIYGDLIAVVDAAGKKVYEYNKPDLEQNYRPTEGHWSSFDLTGTTDPRGVAIGPTYFYVVDYASDQFFTYARDTRLGGASGTLYENTQPIGITTDGTYFWVLDWAVNQPYSPFFSKYAKHAGRVPRGSWDLVEGLGFTGITVYGNYIWVVDAYEDKVFKYRRVPLTCTCPSYSFGKNWEINMLEHCHIDEDCDLGTGTLSFTDTGRAYCDAEIVAGNLRFGPDPRGRLYIQNDCLINLNCTSETTCEGSIEIDDLCGGIDGIISSEASFETAAYLCAEISGYNEDISDYNCEWAPGSFGPDYIYCNPADGAPETVSCEDIYLPYSDYLTGYSGCGACGGDENCLIASGFLSRCGYKDSSVCVH